MAAAGVGAAACKFCSSRQVLGAAVDVAAASVSVAFAAVSPAAAQQKEKGVVH